MSSYSNIDNEGILDLKLAQGSEQSVLMNPARFDRLAHSLKPAAGKSSTFVRGSASTQIRTQ